jgi:hypothetical protein
VTAIGKKGIGAEMFTVTLAASLPGIRPKGAPSVTAVSLPGRTAVTSWYGRRLADVVDRGERHGLGYRPQRAHDRGKDATDKPSDLDIGDHGSRVVDPDNDD